MGPGRAGAWAGAVAVVLLSSAGPVAAGELSVGPRLSISDEADFGIGADVRWAFLRDDPRVALSLSFDHFFPQDEDTGGFDRFFAGFEDLFREAGLPVDFGSPLERKYWEANLNVTYDFSPLGKLVPYAGVGVNYARAEVTALGIASEADDVGANVLVGARFARRFYLEAKREAGGGELFVLTAGVRF